MFYISIFLILLIAGVLYFFVNNRFKKTNHYKNQFVDSFKFKIEIPLNLDVVNLGSNQPKFAFDYADCGLSGMNWAVGPQSLDYDFRLLKQYHSYLKEDALVLIPICVFGFFLYELKNKSANFKYYPFLQPSLIKNYSSRTKFFYIDNPVLTAKRSLISLIKDIPENKQLEITSNPMNDEKIVQDANYWINGWKKQFSIKDLNSIVLSDENKMSIEKNVKILEEMIAFCLERGYRPIMLLLPVTDELSDQIPDVFVDKYILDKIQQANEKNIPILNYLKDNRFKSRDLYFNSFFFNKQGRQIFTKQVIADLAALK